VLTFISDPREGSLSGFSIAENSPVENGSLQHLFSMSWQDPGNTADVADIWVASDLNVPEPSTWAMMLSGFAALGLVAFRRRRSAAVSRALD
jgi:PEP-CTERM motif